MNLTTEGVVKFESYLEDKHKGKAALLFCFYVGYVLQGHSHISFAEN